MDAFVGVLSKNMIAMQSCSKSSKKGREDEAPQVKLPEQWQEY